MAPFATRFLVFFATAYVAVFAILFFFQSRFIYPAPQEPPPLTPGYREVQLNTQDGLALRAFYREAQGDLPTVLYFHGNGGTLSGASVSNSALAQAGLGVLLVEYRGYGGNPGSPDEAGLYRDADAALDWLGDQGIDPGRTIVVGNSIGGGVASRTALVLSQGGTPPAGLILVAPFTSLPDVAAETIWFLPVRLALSDRYDNRAKIAGLGNLPILIQHGDADTLIHDGHGRALAAIARKGTFQSFEGSGHSLSFEPRSQAARLEWILAREQAVAPAPAD